MASAIVFDLGGVLIDWNPRHLYRKLDSDERAIEEFLLEVDFQGWNAAMDRGMPMAVAVQQLKAANVAAAQSLGFDAIQFRTPDELRRDLVRRRLLQ